MRKVNKTRNEKSNKGFSREDRLNAQKEGFSKLDKRNGIYHMIDDTEFKNLGIERFTPESGSVFIAVMPRKESPQFYKNIWVHYGVGPDNNSFLCPNRMFGEDCPSCDYAKELKDDGEDYDIFKEYLPNQRNLMWVVDVTNKRSISKGVLFYDSPATIVKGISGLVVNERTGEIQFDVTDPEDAINIVFKRNGEKRNTKYEAFKTEEREDELPDEYYNMDMPPLDDFLVDPDIDLMEKALGVSSNDREDEEEEEKEKSSKSNRKVKSRNKKEKKDVSFDADDEELEDDDEEELEDDDDEEEEEEPSKKTRRGRTTRNSTKNKNEDEREELEDDEEEEKNTARGRAKRSTNNRSSRRRR